MDFPAQIPAETPGAAKIALPIVPGARIIAGARRIGGDVFGLRMDFTVIIFMGLCYTLVHSVLANRARQRTEVARLLENALKNPAVDRALVESLAAQLSGRAAPPAPAQRAWYGMPGVLLVLGWLTLFGAIAGAIYAAFIRDEGLLLGAGVAGCVGIGLATAPFALRELGARGQA